MSQSRRGRRKIQNDLAGPKNMYDQLCESMYQRAVSDFCPYSYQELINHYSRLWQEYCKAKTALRSRSKTPIDPRYFYNQHTPFESDYKGRGIKIIALIKKFLRNKIYYESEIRYEY